MTLTAEQTEIVAAVREFVDRDVVPVASELEHADEYPESMVETMREMGLFGTTSRSTNSRTAATISVCSAVRVTPERLP